MVNSGVNNGINNEKIIETAVFERFRHSDIELLRSMLCAIILGVFFVIFLRYFARRRFLEQGDRSDEDQGSDLSDTELSSVGGDMVVVEPDDAENENACEDEFFTCDSDTELEFHSDSAETENETLNEECSTEIVAVPTTNDDFHNRPLDDEISYTSQFVPPEFANFELFNQSIDEGTRRTMDDGQQHRGGDFGKASELSVKPGQSETYTFNIVGDSENCFFETTFSQEMESEERCSPYMDTGFSFYQDLENFSLLTMEAPKKKKLRGLRKFLKKFSLKKRR